MIEREYPLGTVVVTGYHDVEELARDRRLGGVGLTMFDLMGIDSGPLREWYSGLMFTNDGPTHDRLRSLVSRAFTPRAVEALRADAADVATAGMARVVDDGEGDLTEVYSLLAMRVMCRLLGVPEADVAVFGGWADDLSPIFGLMEPEQIAAATAAIGDLLAYVDELAQQRRSDPRSDLITSLLAAEEAGDRLTHSELVAMVVNLLVGGHDTTTSQIGCTLLTLLDHPAESAAVRDAPELLHSAVAETIRFTPSIAAVPRTAVEPLTIRGDDVAPGTLVILATAEANREPAIWKNASVFDPRRFTDPDSPRLLSFGAGPHYCLGAALARLTVEEAARATLAAGNIALTEPAADIPWRIVLGQSPARLPVSVR